MAEKESCETCRFWKDGICRWLPKHRLMGTQLWCGQYEPIVARHLCTNCVHKASCSQPRDGKMHGPGPVTGCHQYIGHREE